MASSPWELANALRSPRLIYRAIENTPADIDFLFSLTLDPTVQALTGRHTLRPLSRKTTEAMLPRLQARALVGAIILLAPLRADETGMWASYQNMCAATAAAADSPPIGFLRIGDGDGDDVLSCPGAGHTTTRDADIRLLLKEEYRGQGFGTEAIHWAVDWAFRHANMRRVSTSCYGQDTGAEELYKAIGFVEEGRRRKKAYYNMQWYDEVLLGLLREEWLAMRDLPADDGFS